MPGKAVYDTRFFIEYFYSGDEEALRRLRGDLLATPGRLVSAVTIYETHRMVQLMEGRETARHRTRIMERDFQVVPLDAKAAAQAAEISAVHGTPLPDSAIAAAAQGHSCPVVTDDDHFKAIRGLRTRWPIP
jgi:predicted nucleic acid-binding protein